jgi:hypothetical protein
MANLIWRAATEPPTPSFQPGEAIMIARREFVLGAAAAGVLMRPRFGFDIFRLLLFRQKASVNPNVSGDAGLIYKCFAH